MQQELPSQVYESVCRLSEEGDALAGSREYENAVTKYNEAWSLIPEPKSDWEASTWLLAAIGDACFLSGYFTSCSEALRYAMVCPGGSENPFINLRLGQCEFERNELSEAVEYLLRAYVLEGKSIFEAEHSKYFEFLKSKVNTPASGVW